MSPVSSFYSAYLYVLKWITRFATVKGLAMPLLIEPLRFQVAVTISMTSVVVGTSIQIDPWTASSIKLTIHAAASGLFLHTLTESTKPQLDSRFSSRMIGTRDGILSLKKLLDLTDTSVGWKIIKIPAKWPTLHCYALSTLWAISHHHTWGTPATSTPVAQTPTSISCGLQKPPASIEENRWVGK